MTTPVASRDRRISLAAGVLYVLTFVSMLTAALYEPVKSENYILGSGPDTAAVIGAILEVIVALAGIGTAVVLFPILKKQNESSALGLVAARVLESGTILRSSQHRRAEQRMSGVAYSWHDQGTSQHDCRRESSGERSRRAPWCHRRGDDR